MPEVRFSASRAMAATGQRSVGRIRSKCADMMVNNLGMNVGAGGGASMLFVVESAPVQHVFFFMLAMSTMNHGCKGRIWWC